MSRARAAAYTVLLVLVLVAFFGIPWEHLWT